MNNKNYAEIAKAISEPIGLTKHLVAVKLFNDLKEVPEGLPRPESKIYYCGAVGKVMREGKTLLLLAEDHGCDRGAYTLCLKNPRSPF